MARGLWLCLAFLLAGCGGSLNAHAPDREFAHSIVEEFELSFNGGWEQMDRFERTRWVELALAPSDERRSRYLTRQRATRRIRIHRAELEQDQMVALAQTDFGDWMKCYFAFGDGGHRLLEVRWLHSAAPDEEKGPTSEQQLTSDLDGFLTAFAAAGGFAGAVLVVIEGKPFAALMEERIYAKANMRSSTHSPNAAYAADVAVPYSSILPDGKGKLAFGPERDARRFLPLPAPFGCSFSTTRDLYAFSQALITGRLVSKASLELMVRTNKATAGSMVAHYGYGTMTDVVHGVPYFGHDGGIWGVSAVLRMTADNDVVIALSNVSPGAAQRAAMRAQDLLARLPKSAERKPSPTALSSTGLAP